MPASISVALCTYNGDRFLQHQLQSIAEQTRLPDELVVCDDGSTDDTLSIAESFASRASFPVAIVRNPVRLGVVGNVERATRLCGGTWIALCDQDDVWCATKLETLERVATAQADTDLVFSNATVVDDDLTPLGYSLWDSIHFTVREMNMIAQDRPLDVLLKRNIVTGATTMFRAAIREWCFPVPVGWMHDAWLALIVAVVGRLRATDAQLICYRQHSCNQIGARNPSLLKRATNARRNTRDVYIQLAAQYSTALERVLLLETNGWAPRQPDAAAKIKAKLQHLQVRGSLPPSLIHRLPRVASELLRGAYRDYSVGTLSALRDVIVSQ